MSFQAAKELVKRNTCIEEETIPTSPLNAENPLLQQYKKQEERYQALLDELKHYQKQKQKLEKEKKKRNSEEIKTKKPLSKKEKERSLKVTSIEEIESLLENSLDSEKSKQQILTYLYNEAIEYNKIAKENTSLLEESKKEILEILALIHWTQLYQKEDVGEVQKEENQQNHLIYLTSFYLAL